MATAAPHEAADDRPSVNGHTRGFLKMLCMAAPATARLTPASIPTITLGAR